MNKQPTYRGSIFYYDLTYNCMYRVPVLSNESALYPDTTLVFGSKVMSTY